MLVHSWYVCPYDVTSGPGGSVGRRCAMFRHVPVTPGPAGENWEEAEILGGPPGPGNGFTVVKLTAPLSVHSLVRADADFRRIPMGVPVIPLGDRPGWRTYLTTLGYTLEEVNGTGWTGTGILALLTTAASVVTTAANIITVLAGRRVAPKRVDQIETRLPTSGSDTID